MTGSAPGQVIDATVIAAIRRYRVVGMYADPRNRGKLAGAGRAGGRHQDL